MSRSSGSYAGRVANPGSDMSGPSIRLKNAAGALPGGYAHLSATDEDGLPDGAADSGALPLLSVPLLSVPLLAGMPASPFSSDGDAPSFEL